MVAAYALGRKPAALAMVLSGVVGFFAFAAPQFAWKSRRAHPDDARLLLLNASVAIYLITALTRALAELGASQGRAEAVADSHADLFRELNERISHHLRLVAGVLTLQAKGEPEPDVMRGLQKASERSVLMARVHRELAGRTDAPVDFDAFARRGLMRAVCHARGDDTDRVQIEGARIWLPPEEATSLGMALAECVSALLSRRECGPLRIRMVGAPSEDPPADLRAGRSDRRLAGDALLELSAAGHGRAARRRHRAQGRRAGLGAGRSPCRTLRRAPTTPRSPRAPAPRHRPAALRPGRRAPGLAVPSGRRRT